MSDDDRPALPVMDYDDDFDLNLPPATGQEYLRRVIQEARDCPRVVVANIDAKSLGNNQCVLKCSSGVLRAPSGYAPSLRWQKHQATEFSETRQKFVRWKARMRAQKLKKPDNLPARGDIEGWCRLSFGQLKLQKSSSNHIQNGISECNGTASEGETSTSHNSRSPPLLSFVAFMDQPTVIEVLEYHVNWFEATGFSKEQGEWLYALLVCLEKPLDPEACSLLRNLARICSTLRATLETPDHPFLSQLNLFVCLVAHYFDQKDLADTS